MSSNNYQPEAKYIMTNFDKSRSLDSIVLEFAKNWYQDVVPFYKRGEPKKTQDSLIYDSCEYCPDIHIPGVVYVLLENSRYYSEALEKPIELEMLLTLDNLLVGCYDGGGYFKNPHVAKCWESKVLPGWTYHEKKHRTGHHTGVKTMVFPMADNIYVRNGKVVLEFGQQNHFSQQPVHAPIEYKSSNLCSC
mgnify:CR=1 FL=1